MNSINQFQNYLPNKEMQFMGKTYTIDNRLHANLNTVVDSMNKLCLHTAHDQITIDKGVCLKAENDADLLLFLRIMVEMLSTDIIIAPPNVKRDAPYLFE
jgi:hypothetical protein